MRWNKMFKEMRKLVNYTDIDKDFETLYKPVKVECYTTAQAYSIFSRIKKRFKVKEFDVWPKFYLLPTGRKFKIITAFHITEADFRFGKSKDKWDIMGHAKYEQSDDLDKCHITFKLDKITDKELAEEFVSYLKYDLNPKMYGVKR